MKDATFAECRATGNFDKFVIETKVEWTRLVRNLIRKRTIPPTIDENDILQVIWASCHKFIQEWDPEKGLPISDFVKSRVVDRAKKFIASSRGNVGAAGCNRNRAPSYELCFSGFGEGDVNFDVLSCEPEQDGHSQINEMINKNKALGPIFETFFQTGCFKKTAKKALQVQAARETWLVTKMKTAEYIIEKNLNNVVNKHV